MTLVDTNVWIDFFAGRELPHVQQILEQLLQADANIDVLKQHPYILLAWCEANSLSQTADYKQY